MSLDGRILRALRQVGQNGLCGADLAEQLGVSRAAVWARVEELRVLGYEIEASPHQGYRLMHVPDVLHGDDLATLLGENKVVGRDIRVFQETGSTNDIVEKLAQDGVAEGAVVFAESQTQGRGRLGRKWISPPGKGLWFSVLLRPNLRPQAATQLTIMAGTSVARAIRKHTGLQAQVKWPNDILISGKKVAGILTQLSAELDRIHYVVLGIGIDVNLDPKDFPPELQSIATSLKVCHGREIRRADLAAAVLRELDTDYASVCRGEFNAVAQEWAELCSSLGQRVAINTGTRVIHGRAESLDPDGALVLRTDHGRLERIIGGDVSIEK